MERILLSEDDRSNRTVLCAQLSQAGYTVDEAEDGEAAWDMLNGAADYSIVVTDWRPRLDGLELFKRMQNSNWLRHVPVILQTGSNTPSEVEEGIRAGVYYYLVKPFESKALLALL